MAQNKPSFLYKFVAEKRTNTGNTQIFSPFTKTTPSFPNPADSMLSQKQFLRINNEVSKQIFKTQPISISFDLPYYNSQFRLELVQENITVDKLKVTALAKNNTQQLHESNSLHYRGYINGHPASIACISIFENGDMMGLFANEEGNFNLGKITGGSYILYNNKHLTTPAPSFICGNDESTISSGQINRPLQNAIATPLAEEPVLCKKVRFFWEADYKLFANDFQGNLENTINYLSGLFNQMAVMYENEGVPIELAGMNVWTTTSPYSTESSSAALLSLRQRWNNLNDNFNGDMCMLIDGSPTNNGGRAYILENDLCNRTYAYGYANINVDFNAVPAYSWDVEVVTHEAGHMLGSHHTHWCGWKTGLNGDCGAIDDCSAVEATTGCNTCSATTVISPRPPDGFTGTVMSYCHLQNGIGINLANGFGPFPREAIRTSVSNSQCTVLANVWTGAFDDAWENENNWSCGSIPTDKTDVTIPANTRNQPVIRRNVSCRKLIQKPGSNVTVINDVLFSIDGSN